MRSRAGIVLSGLALCVMAWIVLSGLYPRSPLDGESDAEYERIAPSAAVLVSPPDPDWNSERTRVLLLVRDGRVHVVAREGPDDLIAIGVAGRADEPWSNVAAAGFDDKYLPFVSSVRILGRSRDGGERPTLEAVSLIRSFPEEGRLLRTQFVPALSSPDVATLRITRGGGQVRYRWRGGWGPQGKEGYIGDESVPVDAVLTGTCDLESLRRFLGSRGSRREGARARVVLLQAGASVVLVDVLRAIECCGSDGMVHFWPDPVPWRVSLWKRDLPNAGGADVGLLSEGADLPGRRTEVMIGSGGEVRIVHEGAGLLQESLAVSAVPGVLNELRSRSKVLVLCAHRIAKWMPCRVVACEAVAAGWKVYFAFSPEAGPYVRLLGVDATNLADGSVRVGADSIVVRVLGEERGSMTIEGATRESMRGRVVCIRTSSTACVESALGALLDVLAAGAREVEWRSD